MDPRIWKITCGSRASPGKIYLKRNYWRRLSHPLTRITLTLNILTVNGRTQTLNKCNRIRLFLRDLASRNCSTDTTTTRTWLIKVRRMAVKLIRLLPWIITQLRLRLLSRPRPPVLMGNNIKAAQLWLQDSIINLNLRSANSTQVDIEQATLRPSRMTSTWVVAWDIKAILLLEDLTYSPLTNIIRTKMLTESEYKLFKIHR